MLWAFVKTFPGALLCHRNTLSKVNSFSLFFTLIKWISMTLGKWGLYTLYSNSPTSHYNEEVTSHKISPVGLLNYLCTVSMQKAIRFLWKETVGAWGGQASPPSAAPSPFFLTHCGMFAVVRIDLSSPIGFIRALPRVDIYPVTLSCDTAAS